MKKVVLILSWLIMLAQNQVEAHPFYLSIFEVKVNNQAKTLEITAKIFIDDLNLAINQLLKTKIDLSDANSIEENKKLLAQYFENNLVFENASGKMQQHFLGYEHEADLVFCYLEIPFKKLTEMNVFCNVLMEEYESQTNVFHFYCSEQTQSGYTNSSKTKILINACN